MTAATTTHSIQPGQRPLPRWLGNLYTNPVQAMQTTYTNARQNLASLLDRVVDSREEVVITRADRPSVALIALDELESLRETAYLFRSPANALRLQQAYDSARRGKGRRVDLDDWGRKLGLAAEER